MEGSSESPKYLARRVTMTDLPFPVASSIVRCFLALVDWKNIAALAS